MGHDSFKQIKMYSDYNSIMINGTFLKGFDIINYCRKAGNEALLPVAEFAEEWLQPNSEMVLKTSGSTGDPKLITVHKDQMLFSASLTAGYFGFEPGQNALLCLPVNYIAGKMMIVRAMFSGLNLIVVNPSHDPLKFLTSGTKIDFAAMIPFQLEQVKQMAEPVQIKNLLLGGGPVSAKLENEANDLPIEIFHGYGMTETLSHIALRRVNGKNASQTYKVLPGIELQQDERNCLVISAGKLVNERLVTNDIVEFVSPGQFIWKGRFDNMINSGGIKLFPEELERKLQTFLKRRFYFTSLPDEKLGERLVLIIEGKPFNEVEMLLLNEALKANFTKYEIPKQIYFLQKFIETQTGKINRKMTTGRLIHQ